MDVMFRPKFIGPSSEPSAERFIAAS